VDVDILRVDLPDHRDIVDLTRDLRRSLPDSEQEKFSPNHVLIPAPYDDHGCPWGPPEPTHARDLPPASGPFEPVTIIDSGYQWDASWGTNPLDARGHFGYEQASWLNAGVWAPSAYDVPDYDGDGDLDALAGHANFIAGLIAQRCPNAEIAIRNHNGGFDPASDDFPTEASVARSLCESGGAKVIDLGFAFLALDDAISCVWEVAFEYVRSAMVLAPAGNQHSRDLHFPAALNTKFPGQFPNMIGVASLTERRPGKIEPSHFSNYGDWVTCSAPGTDVDSTFLPVAMPVEEDEQVPRTARDFSASGWARWNGTSFATPKVVAAIAAGLSASTTAQGSWDALKATGVDDPSDQLGTMFPGL
jgi:hypothetical protein